MATHPFCCQSPGPWWRRQWRCRGVLSPVGRRDATSCAVLCCARPMSLRSAALLSVLLLCLSSASSQFVCPVSNQQDTSCYCTSACSAGGDTQYPWTPPAYPVPSVDVGTDTICASVLIPCVNTSSYNALTRWCVPQHSWTHGALAAHALTPARRVHPTTQHRLGVNGDVQYDNLARCDSAGGAGVAAVRATRSGRAGGNSAAGLAAKLRPWWRR
jgi:hypothetical protein